MSNKRPNRTATTADVAAFFADYSQHGVAFTCLYCPHISTVGQFGAYAGTCAGCGQPMRPEAWKRSEIDRAGPVPVFIMTKTQNGGFRGARYSYRVQVDGQTLTYNDNRNFVAGIITRAEILPKRPGEFVYSLNFFTGKASQLGKALTSGGRSQVFAIALIETVRVAGENRVLVRSSSGNRDGEAIDWTELPPEFRRGPAFTTLINDPDRIVPPARAVIRCDGVFHYSPTPEACGHEGRPCPLLSTDPNDRQIPPAITPDPTSSIDEAVSDRIFPGRQFGNVR